MSTDLIVDPGNEKARTAFDRTHGEGAYDEADARTDWGGRRVYAAKEFLEQHFAVPMWRVPQLLPSIGVGLILGAEKSGKSLLGLQMCLTIAAGSEFLGRPTNQCATLLVEEEGAPRAHQARLQRHLMGLGIAESDLPFYLAVREQVRLDDPTVLDWLRGEVRKRNIKVVVIGPLSQVAALENENEAAGVNALMRTLNGLATELGILILIVHHRRKDAAGAGVPNIREFFASARGSSALVAAVDVGLGLTREQEDVHGWLYVLHRDEASFKEHFDFDPASLLVSSSPVPDRNVKAPPADVVQLFKTDGAMGISQVAVRFGVSYNTASERVHTLLDQGLIHKLPGRGKAKYAMTPTTPITWDPEAPPESDSTPSAILVATPDGSPPPPVDISSAPQDDRTRADWVKPMGENVDELSRHQSSDFHSEGSSRPPRKVKEALTGPLKDDRKIRGPISSTNGARSSRVHPRFNDGLKDPKHARLNPLLKTTIPPSRPSTGPVPRPDNDE
jgi:hypothetical protein